MLRREMRDVREWQKALDNYRRLDNTLTKAIESGIGETQLTSLRAQVASAREQWQMWEARMEKWSE